ncbi:MAG: IS256 family transposase [Anaerolineales bacterium]
MLELITKDAEATAPEVTETLDELARVGARRMIAEALELEAEQHIQRMRQLRDEQAHALVVRNGKARERTLTLGAGVVKIRAPRVHDRRPGHRFTSRILPPYMRRSPRLEEALPVLYLRGLSTGDFSEALPVLLGPEAAGLSPTTISRLIRIWQDEYRAWRKRSLVGKDYVYLWADGVYFRVRLEEDRLACLVIIGVLADGTKEVIALEDGYRESQESWASLLRDLKRRGMPVPVLAVGDGALGFWGALREVFPETREQRCWVHKIANVLDKLPKRLQARAKAILHEIMRAPDRQSAEEDILRFREEFEARYPKAVECLVKDQDRLLTFFDFPAEHWIHLRTTNPIESPFATVKARTRQTKGAGSRKAGLALAFKLALASQEHWRKVNAPHLVALVRAGVEFRDGKQVVPYPERDLLLEEEEALRIAA